MHSHNYSDEIYVGRKWIFLKNLRAIEARKCWNYRMVMNLYYAVIQYIILKTLETNFITNSRVSVEASKKKNCTFCHQNHKLEISKASKIFLNSFTETDQCQYSKKRKIVNTRLNFFSLFWKYLLVKMCWTVPWKDSLKILQKPD